MQVDHSIHTLKKLAKDTLLSAASLSTQRGGEDLTCMTIKCSTRSVSRSYIFYYISPFSIASFRASSEGTKPPCVQTDACAPLRLNLTGSTFHREEAFDLQEQIRQRIETVQRGAGADLQTERCDEVMFGYITFGYLLSGEEELDRSSDAIQFLMSLWKLTKSVTYNEGDEIIQRGQRMDELLHVISGRVVATDRRGGNIEILPGEIFAEHCFLDDNQNLSSMSFVAGISSSPPNPPQHRQYHRPNLSNLQNIEIMKGKFPSFFPLNRPVLNFHLLRPQPKRQSASLC